MEPLVNNDGRLDWNKTRRQRIEQLPEAERVKAGSSQELPEGTHSLYYFISF